MAQSTQEPRPPNGVLADHVLPPPPSAKRRLIIRSLRIAFLAATVAVITLIVALPSLQMNPNRVRIHGALPVIDVGEGRDTMTDARYAGLDNRGRPFVIEAGRVRNFGNEDVAMDLAAPQGELHLPSGAVVKLRADDGIYDRSLAAIDLTGNVVLEHSSGYTMKSTEARIDVETSAASGDDPTTAHGPFGKIESEGFRIKEGGDIVLFTGRARMRIEPGAFPEVQ